jgi:hypothetical protein
MQRHGNRWRRGYCSRRMRLPPRVCDDCGGVIWIPATAMILSRILCGTCFAADWGGFLCGLVKHRDPEYGARAAVELARIRAALAG